jgi:hypothetical protein
MDQVVGHEEGVGPPLGVFHTRLFLLDRSCPKGRKTALAPMLPSGLARRIFGSLRKGTPWCTDTGMSTPPNFLDS